MAFPGGNVSRFSLYGGQWHPYGSFAGKTEQVIDDTTGSARGRGRRRRAHKPLRKITLPDGSTVYASADQVDSLRAEYEARVRQEGQAKLEQRRKEKGRRRAKARRVLAEIQVDEGPPIPIPSSYVPTPKVQASDINEIIQRRLDAIQQEEEDALLLLVMLS
jgi:hypothetical protein